MIRRSRHRGSWEAVSRQQQNASQLLDERLDENLRASYVQSGPQAIASAVEEEPEQGDDDAEADDERALAIPMATIRHFVSHSPVTETPNKQRSKEVVASLLLWEPAGFRRFPRRAGRPINGAREIK